MSSFRMKCQFIRSCLRQRLKPWQIDLLTVRPLSEFLNHYCHSNAVANDEKISNLQFNLEKTSYNEFEEQLFKTLSEGSAKFPLSRFLHGIKNAGVSTADPRLSKLMHKINLLKKSSNEVDININLNEMKELINTNRVLTRQLFINNLIIPNFPEFCTKVDDMYWECRKNIEGSVSYTNLTLKHFLLKITIIQ